MRNLHSDVNERLEVRVVSDLVGDFRPELSAFLVRLGLGHLLEEVFRPLCATSVVRAAVAYEERPWPPAGVGARGMRGLAVAVVSDDGQALITPVMLSPQHITNVGLAAGLTKVLFESLAGEGIEWVALFVNERSKVVSSQLASVGFEPGRARVVTHDTSFTAYAAEPYGALAALGLADQRLGDVLALNLDGEQVGRLAAFHLSLAAGLANHWSDHVEWAEVFPGFLDWAALPPATITGTSGPGVDPIDPVIIVAP